MSHYSVIWMLYFFACPSESFMESHAFILLSLLVLTQSCSIACFLVRVLDIQYRMMSSSVISNTKFLGFLKRLPCRGFIFKTPITYSVWQYCTLTSLENVQSVAEKHLTWRCHACLILDTLPWVYRKLAIWLSWLTTLLYKNHPCASRKYRFQTVFGIT